MKQRRLGHTLAHYYDALGYGYDAAREHKITSGMSLAGNNRVSLAIWTPLSLLMNQSSRFELHDLMQILLEAHQNSDEEETVKLVKRMLLEAGFQHVDAYRYNNASIRVRVVDERFRGLRRAPRVDLVDSALKGLPDGVARDVHTMFLFTPEEFADPDLQDTLSGRNDEFENPSPSTL